MATSNMDNRTPNDPPPGERNVLHSEDNLTPSDQAGTGRFFRESNPFNNLDLPRLFQAAMCLFLAVDTGFSLHQNALKGVALGGLGVAELRKIYQRDRGLKLTDEQRERHRKDDIEDRKLPAEEQEERKRRDEERRKEFERRLDHGTRTDRLVRELEKELDPEEPNRRDEETLKDTERQLDEATKNDELVRTLEEEQSNQQKRAQ